MTGPSSPEPVPPQPATGPTSGPPVPYPFSSRPGGGTTATRWVTAGLIVVVIIIGVVSVFGDQLTRGRSGPSVDRPGREPPHIVTYWFTAAGTANEDIEISYTGADGEDQKLSLPGIVPGWSQEVRTEPGLPALAFSVFARSSDLNYSLRCVIEIDGYVEEETEGLASCNMFVRLPRPSRERPRVTRPATPTRTAATTRPPLPTGCRLVSSAEVSEIVLHAAGGVFKTVLSTDGAARRCTYWIDVERGSIAYEWTPGRKNRGIPAALRVPGVDVPTYWFDYGGRSGRLLMYVRGGELRIDIHFVVLEINAKQAALEFAGKARPRLR